MILKSSLGFSEINFSEKKKNSRAPLLLQLLPETSVHPVLPTALIVRAWFPKPEKSHHQKPLHAPDLSPANPPVLISAAASRLLRLSFERHPRLRLIKTNLHQKNRSRKMPHTPPRAGEASGVFFVLWTTRLDPCVTRPARDPYSLLTSALKKKKKKKKEKG